MIITRTPLRISFAGGGTDFPDFYLKYGGAVVSTAIDKYVYVIIKERFDDQIVLNYREREIINGVDEIKHGLMREPMIKVGVGKGVELTTLGDIPSKGSGLGSSSTTLVGLLHALYLYKGRSVDAGTLAREACEIEITKLGRPVGKQDQYIAAYGGLRLTEFNKDGSIETKTIEIPRKVLYELDSHLMLFFTGMTRDSAEILAKQVKRIKQTEGTLLLMKKQAYQVFEALRKGNITFLGKVLDQGWELKKQLANGITTPDIDRMYKLAKRAGAVGGKVSGAGGGGFLLLYVPVHFQRKVRQALKRYRELPFGFEGDGSKAIFNIR